jgi:hypothetical protein
LQLTEYDNIKRMNLHISSDGKLGDVFFGQSCQIRVYSETWSILSMVRNSLAAVNMPCFKIFRDEGSDCGLLGCHTTQKTRIYLLMPMLLQVAQSVSKQRLTILLLEETGEDIYVSFHHRKVVHKLITNENHCLWTSIPPHLTIRRQTTEYQRPSKEYVGKLKQNYCVPLQNSSWSKTLTYDYINRCMKMVTQKTNAVSTYSQTSNWWSLI